MFWNFTNNDSLIWGVPMLGVTKLEGFLFHVFSFVVHVTLLSWVVYVGVKNISNCINQFVLPQWKTVFVVVCLERIIWGTLFPALSMNLDNIINSSMH